MHDNVFQETQNIPAGTSTVLTSRLERNDSTIGDLVCSKSECRLQFDFKSNNKLFQLTYQVITGCRQDVKRKEVGVNWGVL